MSFFKLNFAPLTTLILLGCFWLCCQIPTTQEVTNHSDHLSSPAPPNILWLVTEDMSQYIPPFGDSTIQTPHLSRLADEGIVYTHLFSPSGVCAPSRAAIATGMYPSSIGANHMRTTSYTEVTGLPKYEAVPPAEVKMMSEILRRHGYYCSNNHKEDYQFRAPVTAWDDSGSFAHWRNRDKDQPFFSIFNFTTTHESGLFEPYGFRRAEMRHYQAGDTSARSQNWNGRMTEDETPEHIPKDLDFEIPPYLPNTPVVKRDMWKVYNNIAEMDRQVGAILNQLEADGLLDQTIIFFYADHGGPLPRQKRLIYDSGLRSPMIVRFPDKRDAGSKDDQLLSFIDFAPTVLSLTGIALPSYLQGQAFLGRKKSKEPRKYIHAAADRFDGFTDAIRAVRDGQFKYIRNYRPEQEYYLPVTYREQIPTMQELLRLRDEGKLNDVQAQWFRDKKPPEELFDCSQDPHELNNLIDDPTYHDKIDELRSEMDRWLSAIGDQPNLPEKDLVHQLWKGAAEKPQTVTPQWSEEAGKIALDCQTPGASIGYKIGEEAGTSNPSWSVYAQPITVQKGSTLQVLAHRIGYLPSDTVAINLSKN